MVASVDEGALRQRMAEVMRAMDDKGLNRGTSGNVSARCGEAMLVTPSGVPASRLTADHMVLIQPDGSMAPGALKPSSEWRMHQGILNRRRDVGAVVHCHSRYATTLAVANKPIPAMHYMVAVGGGASVPVAPYATFGSTELAEIVVEVLAGRYAALMANHGQIVAAPNLDYGLAIAEEIEEQAAIYWGALAIGGPTLLADEEMNTILQRFKSYGQGR